MSSCIPCTTSKHAVLVNNCYPPFKEGIDTPQSSELSYLTFYASSKPNKLIKVGSYLLKRVDKDIRKGRKCYNLVSLKILKALIQTCHQNLNIFSKYAVRMMNMLLDTHDMEIIDLTCLTFLVFAGYHDGETLGVDLDLTKDYETLLKKFVGFCGNDNGSKVFLLHYKYNGQRSVQAAISSTAFFASNYKSQLHILFPALIKSLDESDNAIVALQSRDGGSIDIRDSNIDNISPDTIELVAKHSINLLFSRMAGPFVRNSIAPLFEYFDANKKWQPVEFPVNIMKLILRSVQDQYKYLIVSELLLRLDKIHDERSSTISKKQQTLVAILEMVLNSRISLDGISVLELLNSLFNYLITISSQHPFKDSIKDETSIQQRLLHCMEGLAKVLYYENQFNDMVSFVIPKLHPNSSLTAVDSMPLEDYRFVTLASLNSIVRGFNQVAPTNSSHLGHLVSLDPWLPSFPLLYDPNVKTRMQFAYCLYSFLADVPVSLFGYLIETHPNHLMLNAQDFEFMHQLTQAFCNWVQLSNFTRSDLDLLYSFLCLLNRKFGIDATSVLVPLVFKIQQLLMDEQIQPYARRHDIESALIAWFTMTAQFYKIDPLLEYTDSLKKQGGYDAVFTEKVVDSDDEPREFTVSPEDDEKVDRVWIDRGTVVDLMSNYGQLRDASDTHGLDLEARLFAEWGSPAYLKNDFSKNDAMNKNNRVVHDSQIVKPKLTSPFERKNIEPKSLTLEDRKKSIHVSQLKEALYRPAAADDDADTSSSQSNQSTSLPATKPELAKPVDLGAFLDQLKISDHATSTVSLVHPPY